MGIELMLHRNVPRPSCSVCGEVGHTVRSLKYKKVPVLSEEQAKIESMYY